MSKKSQSKDGISIPGRKLDTPEIASDHAEARFLIDQGHGRQRIAKALGWTERRARNAIDHGKLHVKRKPKAPRLSAISQRDIALPRGKVHRFIITSAQDDTAVHAGFWQNLQAYACVIEAAIFVGGFTYQKGLFEDHKTATAVYDPVLRPYLETERVSLTDDLLFVADANVLPTSANPLSGWMTANRGAHVIIPHARIAFESIPRMQCQPARFAMSTGCVTRPSYTPRAAGRKAIFHHTYGATLVEIDADGECFFRQIVAAEDGSFQDLDRFVQDGTVTQGWTAEAVTWGDVHHEQLNPAIALASWGYDTALQTVVSADNLLDYLQPSHQFLHDTLDFRRRNHHDIRDPHQRAKVLARGSGSVEAEVAEAAHFANAVGRDFCQTVLVESNHDAALAKWLKADDGMLDAENAYFWHGLNGQWHHAIRRGDTDFNIVEYAMRHLGLHDSVAFVPAGGSYTLRDVECGLHGDLGIGGSKGSPQQYRRFGPKTSSGHTHTPKIVDGVYVAGVSAELDQGYNRGPTTWAHAHIVLYSNGKRTLIHMTPDGRWRAMGDRNTACDNIEMMEAA